VRQINAAELMAMREESGMGIETCKKIIMKEIMREACANALTVEDLRPIIQKLIDYA
jgi:hypothetical protein